ncbi:hypothetical protein WAF17_11950 [Bernardetia sp. ABR2-2B]|uniref:hypothetical protein n=1 Tax=Bernardetia sp. ABR2-2B TaxID=3127472 RepID=UPI0030CF915F
MKNTFKTFVCILFLVALSTSTFAQLDKKERLVYKLIDRNNAKKLEKLMDKDATFKEYVLNYYSKTERTYLKYAIDECKLKVVDLLAKNKAIIGYTEENSEEILDIYIDDLSCFLSEKNQKCLISSYTMLVENDYVRVRPTLLGRLNCYFDVVPEWYIVMQPVVKALISKGLKAEKNVINITGERENYLLELCKLEKLETEEGIEKHTKTIRNYILFLREQGVDFETVINDKKPIELLSEDFKTKLKSLSK